MVQNEKKICLSHSISQEPHIIEFSFIVLMCKMIISPGVFFSFSKFWFFILLEGKRAKNSTKWPKIQLISQEPYIIWLSFVVHKCKMIIYLQAFVFFFKCFQNFDASGCQEDKSTKNDPKWQKTVFCTLYHRNHHMIFIYGTHV